MRLWLTPATWVLVSVALGLAAGCVPAGKYNDAVAANDRAQAELANSHRNLELLRVEREQAFAELQQTRAALAAREEMLRNLRQANADLQRRLAEMGVVVGELRDAPLPPAGAMVALPAELDARLQEWARQYPGLVEYDRATGMVKLGTDLVFARGSDEVAPEARATLQRFAEIIRGTQGFHVFIAGHTDDIPIRRPETLRRHPDNWYLSVHRAVSVVDSLIQAGVEPSRLAVGGYSMYRPVAPNAAQQRGNPANRRVELWIVPPERLLTGGTATPGQAAPAATRPASPTIVEEPLK